MDPSKANLRGQSRILNGVLNCAQLTSLRVRSKPLSTSEISRDLTSRGNRRPCRAGAIRCSKGDSYGDASGVEEMDGGKGNDVGRHLYSGSLRHVISYSRGHRKPEVAMLFFSSISFIPFHFLNCVSRPSVYLISEYSYLLYVRCLTSFAISQHRS